MSKMYFRREPERLRYQDLVDGVPMSVDEQWEQRERIKSWET